MGAFLGPPDPFDIDVAAALCGFGHDGHLGAGNLGEAAANAQMFRLTTQSIVHLTDVQGAQEGDVAEEDAELALHSRAHHHVRLGGQHQAVGSNHFQQELFFCHGL